jgi:hypothetical protein
MSLATVCSRMAALVGVAPTTSSWIGNPELTASEIVAWVQEAQQQVAASYDWATLTGSATVTLASTGGVMAVPLAADVARIVPDTMYLAQSIWVRGPLTHAEWQELTRIPGTPGPAFTLAQGKIQLAAGGFAGPLAYRYITAVPDYTTDGGETALGGGQAELVRLMERCVLYSAIALYRDAKGLPSSSATAQAMGCLAEAKTRDQPIGPMTLVRRRLRDEVRGRMVPFVLDNAQSAMQ